MGRTYTLRFATVDANVRAAREIARSTESDRVEYYVTEALRSIDRLEPAPAVHTIAGLAGVPEFWDRLRHFVGDGPTYYLEGEWLSWVRDLPTALSEDPTGERLALKLLGETDSTYRLSIEGDEYRFERGAKFLTGDEIGRLGDSIRSCEDVLLEHCPDDSYPARSTIQQGAIKRSLDADEFLSKFVADCRAYESDSILWLST